MQYGLRLGLWLWLSRSHALLHDGACDIEQSINVRLGLRGSLVRAVRAVLAGIILVCAILSCSFRVSQFQSHGNPIHRTVAGITAVALSWGWRGLCFCLALVGGVFRVLRGIVLVFAI